ncbi:MAG: hypothetical protein LBR17_00070 [Bacteroidales bacterium]|jgi:hypothetical protein|nr:hypothetical protein [Bacteroidales bacterium]
MIKINKYLVMALAMVAFAGCSEEETSQNTNNNVPENAKKIGYVDSKGNIQLLFSQENIINRYEQTNKSGLHLEYVDIRDNKPMSLDSQADLLMGFYDDKTSESFSAVRDNTKIVKQFENGVMCYYLQKNTNKLAGGGSGTNIVRCYKDDREPCSVKCNAPVKNTNDTYSCICPGTGICRVSQTYVEDDPGDILLDPMP